MPEEINRLVTDRLADLLLTPDHLSGANLAKEGVPDSQIKFVGNIMIDTLDEQRNTASRLNIHSILRQNLLSENAAIPTIGEEQYALMTLHRPANVDHREILHPIIEFLTLEVAAQLPHALAEIQ